jgi:hypothetical protein
VQAKKKEQRKTLIYTVVEAKKREKEGKKKKHRMNEIYVSTSAHLNFCFLGICVHHTSKTNIFIINSQNRPVDKNKSSAIIGLGLESKEKKRNSLLERHM